MAVERLLLDSQLRVRYQVGEDINGEPIYWTRALARIHPGAGDGEIFALAQTVSGLQLHPLAQVLRGDYCELYHLG